MKGPPIKAVQNVRESPWPPPALRARGRRTSGGEFFLSSTLVGPWLVSQSSKALIKKKQQKFVDDVIGL